MSPPPRFSVSPPTALCFGRDAAWGGALRRMRSNETMFSDANRSNAGDSDGEDKEIRRDATIRLNTGRSPLLQPIPSPPREVARSMGDRSLRIPQLQMPSPRQPYSLLSHSRPTPDISSTALPPLDDDLSDSELFRDLSSETFAYERPVEVTQRQPLSRNNINNGHAVPNTFSAPSYTSSREPTSAWAAQVQTANGAAWSLDNHPPHRAFNQKVATPSPAPPTATATTFKPTYSSPLSGNGSGSGSADRLREAGWVEYEVRDETRYYVHKALGITTDYDLRVKSVLDDVSGWISAAGLSGRRRGMSTHSRASTATPTTFFGERLEAPTPPTAMLAELRGKGEVWLHQKMAATKERRNKSKTPFSPAVYFVDHQARTALNAGLGSGEEEEDQLDTEYRYWSFVEAHPVHTTLPESAKIQAMDTVTWAWADHLLPSKRAIPASFTKEECRELMTLLRGFDNDRPDDSGTQTRLVSRIFIRSLIWKQMHFRASQPLPRDVGSHHLISTFSWQRTIWQMLINILVGLLCVGIPELGLFSHWGALASLVVATLALVALITVFGKSGNIIERSTRRAGSVISGLTVSDTTPSLPTFIIAYSLLALTAGIAFYAFRGRSAFDPGSTTHKAFHQTTDGLVKWLSVALVGAVGSVLATTSASFIGYIPIL